eukprot:2552281-Rhodomonas_salina.1
MPTQRAGDNSVAASTPVSLNGAAKREPEAPLSSAKRKKEEAWPAAADAPPSSSKKRKETPAKSWENFNPGSFDDAAWRDSIQDTEFQRRRRCAPAPPHADPHISVQC